MLCVYLGRGPLSLFYLRKPKICSLIQESDPNVHMLKYFVTLIPRKSMAISL